MNKILEYSTEINNIIVKNTPLVDIANHTYSEKYNLKLNQLRTQIVGNVGKLSRMYLYVVEGKVLVVDKITTAHVTEG